MEKETTQEGAVEEPQKEETSTVVSEAASTEEKATSEKQKDEDWKRMMQSRADTAESKAQKLETELQKLRDREKQQRLETRQKEIASLADEPDEQAKVKRKHELEDTLSKLEEQRTQEEGAVQRKYDQAIELASKHNLSLADARELMNAETRKEMELQAQLKVAELRKVQGKVQSEDFPKPDSATSDAAPSDFKQLEKNFIADPYKYGKAYKEALAKRGQ